MGLEFTDEQLRTVSGEVLAIPDQITALIAQKASIEQGKVDTKTKDEGNEAFYDFYLETVNSYQSEIKNIDGATRDEYLDSFLQDSAQQLPGNPHYPSAPPWVNMKPKLLTQNNGNPTAPFGPYEGNELTLVGVLIGKIKTGYVNGADDDTLTDAYVNGTDVEVDNGGYAVGQTVVIDDSGVSLLAVITDVLPPSTTGAEDLELSVLTNPAVVLGAGARIRNFHPGFNDTEREGGGTPDAPEVLQYWSDEIDTEVAIWEQTLDEQNIALATLDPGGSENTDRDTAITDVTNAISDIDTWQAAPATGVGTGRFGDTVLAPLETKIIDRTSEVPARAAAIVGFLGTVTQNPDGTFAGTGHYTSLFKWIDIRIAKSGGTLFGFYNFDLLITYTDSSIANAVAKQAEYTSTLLVASLAEDSDGTEFIKLVDATGLSVSDAVSVVDDDTGTAIFNGTIVGISTNTVEVDGPVSGFLLDKRARLVKIL